MIKPKPCKGINKALGYGCDTSVLRRVHGLCDKCYYSWLLTSKEGKEKVQRSTLKAKKETKTIRRKETKELKDSLMTVSDLKKILQVKVNKIVRLIDKGHPCMMCANPNMKRINACHYHSVGSNGSLRFNLLNNWHGCHRCNAELGGNINGYDVQIVETYGKDFWEFLKFDLVRAYQYIKLSKEDLREVTKDAQGVIKRLEKLDKVYTIAERMELREQINEELAIYV